MNLFEALRRRSRSLLKKGIQEQNKVLLTITFFIRCLLDTIFSLDESPESEAVTFRVGVEIRDFLVFFTDFGGGESFGAGGLIELAAASCSAWFLAIIRFMQLFESWPASTQRAAVLILESSETR